MGFWECCSRHGFLCTRYTMASPTLSLTILPPPTTAPTKRLPRLQTQPPPSHNSYKTCLSNCFSERPTSSRHPLQNLPSPQLRFLLRSRQSHTSRCSVTPPLFYYNEDGFLPRAQRCLQSCTGRCFLQQTKESLVWLENGEITGTYSLSRLELLS